MSQGFEGSTLAQPVLHHVNLKTTRMQEMIDWYATVAGLTAVFQFPGGAWLTNDAANHRLALLTSSKMSDDSGKLVHTGMHHLAFEYAAIDDLLSAYTRLKEMIESRAEALVERLVAQRSFDAVEDLAQALPLSIVPDFIGLSHEVREHLLDWAEATFNAMGSMNERCTKALETLPEVFGYARQIAASGNLQPGSFGAGVLEAERDGRITAAQCPQLLTAYLVPSMDTTISAVGSAIWLFGRYPEQWDQVRENPSLIPNAFEEVLRLESPLQSFTRKATSDSDVEGISIPLSRLLLTSFEVRLKPVQG